MSRPLLPTSRPAAPSPEVGADGARRRSGWRAPPLVVLLALVSLAAGYVPSLLPRPWHVQGAVGAVAGAVGYGLGSLLATGRWGRAGGRRATAAALAAGGALVAWSLGVHAWWQADLRRLMGMGPGVAAYLLAAVAVSLVGGALLVAAGRVVGRAWRRSVDLLARILPRAWAVVVGVVAAVVLVVVGLDVLVADRLLNALDQAYLEANRRFDPGVEQPLTPTLSGSPDSLIPWERLGSQGRAFVTEGPGREVLAGFAGAPIDDPVRVYAGLQTAGTIEERARLAVADLDRAGGFTRRVLALVAPTGSGWVDPYAVDALELMYGGDVASVAVQYSHRASWMVMAGNQDLAVEASRALLREVEARLATIPPARRPLLLLYGESLGAFGWETAFADLDDFRDRVGGALLVGPPRSNRIWQALTAARDDGSPVWAPVVEGGRAVRFGADGPALAAAPAEWERPRIAYLQHPSDPITWWTPGLALHRPEWMEGRRGPDVSQRMPWVPVATAWQLAIDLALGTSAPEGHGHKFGIAQAEAWTLVAPPDGWSGADTARLLATLEAES